jgi:hypothetical protein
MDLGELPIALGHSLNALAGRATHWRALQARPVPRGTARFHRTSKLISPARGGARFRVFEFFICFVFFCFLYPAARAARLAASAWAAPTRYANPRESDGL